MALHITGTMNGTNWRMTLSTQTGHMLLQEQQIRGTDLHVRGAVPDAEAQRRARQRIDSAHGRRRTRKAA